MKQRAFVGALLLALVACGDSTGTAGHGGEGASTADGGNGTGASGGNGTGANGGHATGGNGGTSTDGGNGGTSSDGGNGGTSTDGGGGSTSDGGGGSTSDDTTIYDVQQSLAVGDQVNVRGVVVTAIDSYGAVTGDVWVEEPGGGPYSGVLVFGMNLSDVAALTVGDLIDLEDVVKDEFALASDTSGRTLTELAPPSAGSITVTKVGTAAVPAPEQVDALAIGQLPTQQAQDDEWEKWEGVLIEVGNVSVLSPTTQVGATDPLLMEFRATGPLRVASNLAPLITAAQGDCLDTITGIGSYFFNYKLIPRATADAVAGGTGCPLPESTANDCDDTIDNDANGFVDCADNSCSVLPQCIVTATIADIQTGTVTGQVNVPNVFITARSKDQKHLWVADHLQGAPNEGIFVYRGGAAAPLDASFAIGATVTVTGTVQEFDPSPPGDTLTEISSAAVTLVSAPTTPPLPLMTTVVAAGDIGPTGEPFEGVLVHIGGTATSILPGHRVTLVDNGGAVIVMDDDIFSYPDPTLGDFLEVTGIMSINLTDDERRLLPRSALDIVDTGS